MSDSIYPDRPTQYQEQCRDFLINYAGEPNLVPYEGDGINIDFEVAGTEVEVDVALKNPEDELVLAESKSKNTEKGSPIKRGVVADFAHTVSEIRKTTGRRVAGFFFLEGHMQPGGIKHGDYHGIKVVRMEGDQRPDDIQIHYLSYDKDLDERIEEDRRFLRFHDSGIGTDEVLIAVSSPELESLTEIIDGPLLPPLVVALVDGQTQVQ